MSSVTRIRYSLAAFGIVALGTTLAQLASINLSLPFEQIGLAFNLTRVLIQL